MKTIQIEYLDDSQDDCQRYEFVTEVDGKMFVLASEALSNKWTTEAVKKKAREIFGDDIIIMW